MAKTLHEIRSDACNAILLTLTLLATPAAGFSLLRGVEQGFRPVMGLHILLAILLCVTAIYRHRLSLAVRAGVATAVPYVIATSGIVANGRGTGVMMFYISAIVVAGCFFERRIALGIVGLCVATLGGMYVGYRLDIIPIPLAPAAFDMTPLSWAALIVGFVAAGAAPLIGLSALLRLLDAERARADAAVKVRSNFLANMSHEIRTPMAGIMGMADVLKTTPLSDQQKTLIANLTLSAKNLLGVLNDVLDFAKFETGQIPLEKAPFRLHETVGNACAVFENRAADKGIVIRIEIAENTPDHVIGDSLRIGQILSNLIDNAIKFTPQGVVVVRVEHRARADGLVDLTFSVLDTGIGIAPEHLERIFEPFIQADMSTSRLQGGTGLGLSICRHLAEAMGGTLVVKSEAGNGSIFSFTIPLERAGATPVALVRSSERSLPSPAASPPRTQLRVLIADDDHNMRTLADIMLLRRGYEVSVVDDGAAAVGAAAAAAYDCIVIDMHMPVMNGCDAMRAIQNGEIDACRPHTPIIALTADIIPEHIKTFVDAGADAVLAKPVNWDQLDAKIRELAVAPRAAKAS